MGFRPTPEIRTKLEETSKANGRSMSQEVEARLERSFTIDEGFGDADTFEFCRLLAQMANMMTATSGKRWKDDPGWFMYVVGAWAEMVKVRASQGQDPDASPGLELFGKLELHNFDKASSEELRDLGAQAFAVAKMRSNEIEEK